MLLQISLLVCNIAAHPPVVSCVSTVLLKPSKMRPHSRLKKLMTKAQATMKPYPKPAPVLAMDFLQAEKRASHSVSVICNMQWTVVLMLRRSCAGESQPRCSVARCSFPVAGRCLLRHSGTDST